MPGPFTPAAGQLGNLAGVVSRQNDQDAERKPDAPDPVVALYAEWRAALEAHERAEAAADQMRAALVERLGDPSQDPIADDRWDHDPDLPELRRLNLESEFLSLGLIPIEDEIMETEATTVEGARCKLLVAISLWEHIEQPGVPHEAHEHLSLALLRGAERALAAGRAA